MNKKRARKILIALIASLFLLACNCNTIQSLIATPTPTLTATPLPTATPVPTSTPADPADAALTLADMPPGFDVVAAEDMGLNPADYLSVFAFMNVADFEIVYGFNNIYESTTDLAGFSLAIDNPDLMMEALASGMDLDPTDMETFAVTGVGESACGIGATGNMEGIMMRMEIVMFLRGNIGSTLILMYQNDQAPGASIIDLARIWDGRLAQALP